LKQLDFQFKTQIGKDFLTGLVRCSVVHEIKLSVVDYQERGHWCKCNSLPLKGESSYVHVLTAETGAHDSMLVYNACLGQADEITMV
jgi:uncharacterized protein (DUF427 family)